MTLQIRIFSNLTGELLCYGEMCSVKQENDFVDYHLRKVYFPRKQLATPTQWLSPDRAIDA